MDKLIDDIIELILGDMDCHHEVDHDEDGTHMSVEYNLNNETKLRGMIRELIQKPGVTEEFVEKWGRKLNPHRINDFEQMLKEAGVRVIESTNK